MVYPNPVRNGLMLWFDSKSYENNNAQKQIARNLVTNSKTGKLNNFAYTDGSGYKDGVQFDGVDDFISFSDITVDNFTNKERFTFEFTITFTNSNKRGAVFCVPMTLQNDGSKRLMVKVTENREVAIGRYNGAWKGKKTLPVTKDKVNVALTFEDMESSDFILNAYVNGKPFDLTSGSVASSEYYGNPYSHLVIGWQGTNSQPENAYLKEIIHSARIYDRVLSSQEILNNYLVEKERWEL